MKVTLEFTIDEANYILAALGARPFAEVADLISRIKAQAEEQLKASQETPAQAE